MAVAQKSVGVHISTNNKIIAVEIVHMGFLVSVARRWIGKRNIGIQLHLEYLRVLVNNLINAPTDVAVG